MTDTLHSQKPTATRATIPPVDPGVLSLAVASAATRLVWPPRHPPAPSQNAQQPAPEPAAPRKPLRLWPISDLHVARHEGWPAGQIPQADVAVVAGDVTEGLVDAIGWLGQHIRPHMRVVFVAGNHEYWGTLHERALEQGRIAAGVTDIDLLEGEAVVIERVRFAGATLWTDYHLLGEAYRWAAQQQARLSMSDHSQIGWRKQPWQRLQPEDAAGLHKAAIRDLERLMREPHPGPTVVVTHHAPHPNSLARDQRASLISAAYASDLTEQIGRWNADLWIHGHTHHAVDYRLGSTRILSNPRGYKHEREAIGFQPLLVVEV